MLASKPLLQATCSRRSSASGAWNSPTTRYSIGTSFPSRVFGTRTSTTARSPPEGEHIVTLTFSEHAGLTHFTQHILHTSKQNRDGHLKSGFTSGLDDTFARFDQLLVATAAA